MIPYSIATVSDCHAVHSSLDEDHDDCMHWVSRGVTSLVYSMWLIRDVPFVTELSKLGLRASPEKMVRRLGCP